MFKYIFSYFFAFIFCFILSFPSMAQETRRLSINAFGGVGFFPKDKKNNADMTTRVMGGYNPTPLAGLGLYYRLTNRFSIGESYTYLFPTQSSNRSMNAHSFKTSLKFSLLPSKRLNPYLLAGFNVNLVTINRKERIYDFIPDPSNPNVIGNGFMVDSIHYFERSLKLQRLPILGASLGAGFEFKISKKFNVFAEYTFQANAGKKNDLVEKYYFSNQSNFTYHSVTAGVSMNLFKPQKQLLAVLKREDWKNGRNVDVKGTIIYKKPNKPYNKILPVEKTDTLENVFEIDPTDERGIVFFAKNVEIGDYQFMLPKRMRRIIRADLQILNYNRIEIEDEDLELEMIEEESTENILSRDANFAVLLREGFQHEVELSTTAENIMGKFTPTDANCRVRILLKNQYDSVIAYIDTLVNNEFNFIDVKPGNYKVAFQRLNDECAKTEFMYSFTGAKPFVNKQSNQNETENPTPKYSINGDVQQSGGKKEAPKGTVVKLIDPTGRVEKITKLEGPKNTFNYSKLNSPDYEAVLEDQTDKSGIGYKVKDTKPAVIREVKRSLPKKETKASIAVNGKLELPNPQQSSTVSVLLVDSTGKVKQKTPLKPDGTFVFENLPKNNYKVAYESTDPIVRGKLSYNSLDKSLKISKIMLPELTASIEKIDTIHYAKNNKLPSDTNSTIVIKKEPTDNPVIPSTLPEPIKTVDTNAVEVVKEPLDVVDTTKKVVVVEPNKTEPTIKKNPKTKEVPIKYPFTQFKPGTTYNDLGYEVKPEGYGIQISSFFINSNLEKFCQRVRAKGEKNIFIQVIYKDKANPDAGIIYRVIIGADDDKEKMLKKVPSYNDKGYDAVLRKHLAVTSTP